VWPLGILDWSLETWHLAQGGRGDDPSGGIDQAGLRVLCQATGVGCCPGSDAVHQVKLGRSRTANRRLLSDNENGQNPTSAVWTRPSGGDPYVAVVKGEGFHRRRHQPSDFGKSRPDRHLETSRSIPA
jgi:hypothetical protein